MWQTTRKACPSRAWCNQVHTSALAISRNARCRRRGSRGTSAVLEWRPCAVTHSDAHDQAESRMMERFAAARPLAQTHVQSLPTDVTDLAALRLVGALLSDKD